MNTGLDRIMTWFGAALSSVGWISSNFDLTSAEAIVSMVCAIIGVIIAIISGLVIPLIKWWKEAKKDGKIDADELDEAVKIIESGTQDVADKIKDVTKEKKDND